MDVMAGADFFTVEVLTWRGLATYYVLFFLHLGSRRVTVAGITRHPGQEWMEQIARSASQETWGYLHPCRYVLHDRDTKFCASFRSVYSASARCRERWPNSALIITTKGTTKERETNYSSRILAMNSDSPGHTVACRQRLGGLLKFYGRAA
jgi:hypothetical protein